jgi:hypothetical protein
MPMTKEWAIRDEETGEWWSDQGNRWSGNARDAVRLQRYRHATAPFAYSAVQAREGARIVEAPPREMTNEECVAWVARVNNAPVSVIKDILSITVVGDHWQVRSDIASPRVVGDGPTLFDAIRAAAKKLGA